MSIIPDKTIDVIRTFNDLAIDIYGIDCVLYIPTNLDAIEGKDMYKVNSDIVYKEYTDQKVWVNWAIKDFNKLRKLGIYNEGDLPIAGHFKVTPEVIIQSYIKVPIRYIPDQYNTDEFEIVNSIMVNIYNAEIFRRYKLAPRRENNA